MGRQWGDWQKLGNFGREKQVSDLRWSWVVGLGWKWEDDEGEYRAQWQLLERIDWTNLCNRGLNLHCAVPRCKHTRAVDLRLKVIVGQGMMDHEGSKSVMRWGNATCGFIDIVDVIRWCKELLRFVWLLPVLWCVSYVDESEWCLDRCSSVTFGGCIHGIRWWMRVKWKHICERPKALSSLRFFTGQDVGVVLMWCYRQLCTRWG